MASTLPKVWLACIGTGYALRHAQSETGRRQSPPTSRCFHPPSSRCRAASTNQTCPGILHHSKNHAYTPKPMIRSACPTSFELPSQRRTSTAIRSPQGQKLFVLPTKCQNGQNTNMRQLCPHAMPKLTSLFFYIFLETASECTAKSIISARVSQSGCPSVLISFTRMFRLRLVWGYLLLFETC